MHSHSCATTIFSRGSSAWVQADLVAKAIEAKVTMLSQTPSRPHLAKPRCDFGRAAPPDRAEGVQQADLTVPRRKSQAEVVVVVGQGQGQGQGLPHQEKTRSSVTFLHGQMIAHRSQHCPHTGRQNKQ